MLPNSLYDNREKFKNFDITVPSGVVVLKTTPARLIRVIVGETAISSSLRIFNGVTVAGELVADILTASSPEVGSIEYGVVLSGGLTIERTVSIGVTIIYR